MITLEFQNIKTFLLKDTLLLINNLNGELIAGTFYEKELQKPTQEKFRIDKVIKRKSDRMLVKWKGYNNSFNSWINKKDIV